MPRKFNLTGADGMRALACLAVMLHHFTQRINIGAQPIFIRPFLGLFLMGNSGVSIFFVLSGFLLSYPFWSHYLNNQTYPDLKAYFLRRAGRLIPGYYLSILVCTALVLTLNIPSVAVWHRAIAGLTFTSCFHYVTFFPSEINGPLWSISFEVFCYFLMPLFMFGLFLITRHKKRSFRTAFAYWCGAFILILILNQWVRYTFATDPFMSGWQYGLIGGAKYWMPNYNPIGFFAQFAIGIFAAGFTAKLKMSADKFERFQKAGGFDTICTIAIIAAVLLLFAMCRQNEFALSWQSQPYYFPYLTVLIGTILALAPHTKWFGKLLDNRFLRFTAKISFGLYLWHYVIIFFTFMFVTPQWNQGMMNIPDIKSWLMIIIPITIVSYAIATLSYYFLEKPVIDWTHKLSSKKAELTNALSR